MEKFKIVIKRIILQFKLPFLMLFSRFTFLSALYYTLLSKSFWREFNSVLSGRFLYLKRLNKKTENIFLLRRNVHRLEKGLLMIPRKPVFGIKYIEELVDVFEYLIKENNYENIYDELHWAYDVLTKYFSVVKDNPIILKSKIKFDAINIDFYSKKKKIPFNKVNDKPAVGIELFNQLVESRRSVRWFLKKPVPRKMIDQAILNAVQSPSSCNRLPYEFRVIDDEKLVNKISEIPMGTKGFANNIPVMIAVIGHLDAFFDERDRHLIYIDSSLASMAMILSFETMGLSTCCLNWPDIPQKEKKINSFLELNKNNRVIMLIALGWADPDGKVAYSEKKSLNVIRKYNE